MRCRVAVRGLSREPFIEVATIGLSRPRVLWRHVLPNLRDLILIEAAYAMGAVLLLVAEMGFLAVVLGGAFREHPPIRPAPRASPSGAACSPSASASADWARG